MKNFTSKECANVAVSSQDKSLEFSVNGFIRDSAYVGVKKRIGMAKGVFTCCGDFESCNDEIAEMFEV